MYVCVVVKKKKIQYMETFSKFTFANKPLANKSLTCTLLPPAGQITII